MMGSNKKLIQIAEKRNRLIAEAASQRSLLGQNMELWRKPLSLADQALQVVAYIRSHPALLIGAGVALVVLSPKRTAKWLKLGWTGWLFLRKFRIKP
ncbi:MAG: YqjK-like family protein [Nitrosomonadales bacterium]|nr:YqjK-like family protein [Nitrosomonadales bacterium]